MEFSKERIMLNKIGIVGGCIARETIDIPSWRVEKGYYNGPQDYDRAPYTELHEDDHWKCGLCDTYWFSADVEVPASWQGGHVCLELDFGGEALVRINGRIVSAVTSYLQDNKQQRNRVNIDPSLIGTTIHIEAECALNYLEFYYLDPRTSKKCLHGKQWVEYTLRKTRLVLVDDEIEAYYFDAMVAYEALDELKYDYDRVRRGNVKMPGEIRDFMYHNGGDSYLHSRVLEALQRSLTHLDVDLGTEALIASIPEAARILKEGLAAIEYTPRGHVVFTGNSHIDTAWLWPLKETIRKAAKTFANTLALMDQYPNHVFAASQPWQYAQVKKYYPELFKKIRQRVQEGRWELIGNSWVEADSNVPSGEALVRQLLYGREFFLKEFGKASDVYWMPDVFGYSWALPQIIKRSGMKYFFTAKLNNSDLNRFPHTLFEWQGTDGTRIPAYLQRMGYNGEVNPHHANHTWREFDQKNVTETMFQTYGYGDGGGGATYQMLEYAPRIEHFPGLPDTSIDRTEAFFSTVPEKGLPVWNDEMYYEFHRGTYTSQAFVKKSNRKGELALRETEMAASLSEMLLKGEYPMEEITESWKLLLLNQFHDIIPGSSIHAVYEDCKRDYAEMFRLQASAQQKALSALTGAIDTKADSVVVYNFLSWKRGGLVELNVGREKKYVQGAKCALRQTAEGDYILSFLAEDVPSMGWKTYALTGGEAADEVAMSASERVLDNGLLRVTLDENGLISSIWDYESEREILAGRGNLLTVFEDKPEVESAWNIDIEYKNKFWNLEKADSIEAVECTPVRAAVKVVRSFNKSTVTQTIALYPNSRRVDFITHADWQETEKMLKAAFPVDILSPKATYEIAYGAIERTTHENTSWDRAKFEVAAHKWGDLSEGGYGVALMNDCKYGYDVKENVMRLTLLRSPIYPDPVADRGEHDFTYSLYPHAGGWREGGVVRAGYELNVPLTAAVTGAHAGALPAECEWIHVDGEGAVVEAFKKSQDGEGWILRIYEANGGRGKVCVRTAFGLNEVWETNLMEEKEARIEAERDGFCFAIKPHEIRTFLIQ